MNQTDSASSQNEKPHSVYLIANGRNVKIGHAGNPNNRLTDLGTASDAPLTLEWTWEMTRAEAVRFEAEMHAYLSMHRVHREWFDISPRSALLVGCALRRGDTISANKILLCEWTLGEVAEDAEDTRLALLARPEGTERTELEADVTYLRELRESLEDELEWWWCEMDPEDEGLE